MAVVALRGRDRRGSHGLHQVVLLPGLGVSYMDVFGLSDFIKLFLNNFTSPVFILQLSRKLQKMKCIELR